MFRIGDFSHLAQVSIRTLRYYDEIGLLKPAHIDRFTDYRYYTIEQLPRLNRILALKDLGFSLDQVVKVMKDDVPLEQLQGMLLLKQAELGQHIKDEEQCLRRIASRLKQIEREGKLSEYEVVIKRVDALTIVSSRVVVPTIDDMQRYRCSRLTAIRQWTRQEPKESTRELFLYHLPEFREQDIDMEVAVMLDTPTAKRSVPPNGLLDIRELPASVVASVVHQGRLYDVGQAMAALFTWIGSNGYTSTNPIRELHLFWSELDKNVDFEEITVEIQIGVEKA